MWHGSKKIRSYIGLDIQGQVVISAVLENTSFTHSGNWLSNVVIYRRADKVLWQQDPFIVVFF